MAVFQTSIDYQNNLSIHTVTGEVTAQEILQKLEAYFAGEPTMLVLWNFSEAKIAAIPSDEFRRIPEVGKKYAGYRKGGKTALVFSSDAGFGMGRMFEAFSEIEGLSFVIRSFRSVEAAKQWLGIEHTL